MKKARPIVICYFNEITFPPREIDKLNSKLGEILEDEYIRLLISDSRRLQLENRSLMLEVISIDEVHHHKLSKKIEDKLEEYMLNLDELTKLECQ